MEHPTFWDRLDQLVASTRVIIERPKGTAHPRFPHMIFPLDYGCLAGTSGGDGNALDVWIGSLPDRRLDAVICTVDLAKCDAEVKLLLGCTDAEKQTIFRFHNGGPQSAMLIRREPRLSCVKEPR